jgi:NAD+ synthase
VWQLAESLGVPKSIIQKPPSADLWAGQTDEGELGFSYKRVDHMLYYMVDERRNDSELREMGFEDAFVQKVKGMIRMNHFKRRMPLVAKVSNRTMNIDFRYPRDWGT